MIDPVSFNILMTMSGMRLLQEFIRVNVGTLFGLDRSVTMNALVDVVGGPDIEQGQMTPSNMRFGLDDTSWDTVSASPKVSMVDDDDVLEGILAIDDETPPWADLE